MDNENALIKTLNQRIGTIKKLGKFSSFKTRKIITNGIYLMPAWLGCEEYLVDALQVCQNKAARLVTKLDRFTLHQDPLEAVWLAVSQATNGLSQLGTSP